MLYPLLAFFQVHALHILIEVLKIVPIMLALCLILLVTYYAGIILIRKEDTYISKFRLTKIISHITYDFNYLPPK